MDHFNLIRVAHNYAMQSTFLGSCGQAIVVITFWLKNMNKACDIRTLVRISKPVEIIENMPTHLAFVSMR
jgi:ABC-type uncharacterized transport system ATPase subunit